MPFDIGDTPSTLFRGLSGFWLRFFKDTRDLEAYYQASEVYLGQVYLDLLSSILNIGIIDTPIFNKEYWKLFAIDETELNFKAGVTSAGDRFVYDMPGSTVLADFLQNTIFDPEIVMERDVDFEILEDDGLMRFYADPFRAYQDLDGNWAPQPGIAWRTVRKEVGNRIIENRVRLYGTSSSEDYYSQGVRKGDTLRVLAYRGDSIVSGAAGGMSNVGINVVFDGILVGADCKVGDTLQIYGHSGPDGDPDDAFRGRYLIREILNDNSVKLNPDTVSPLAPTLSTNALYWRTYKANYFDVARDYEIDYLDGYYGVGSSDNPYPTDVEGPVVYSVVRTPADPEVLGVVLNWLAGAPGNLSEAERAVYTTDLGVRHLVPGTVKVVATTPDTFEAVQEGTDYTVNYLDGSITQLRYWYSESTGRCSYQYSTEVLISAGGDVESYTVGNVKQLSVWVPEVAVDRFTLWYNYGSLLNRFEASSENYKAFLRGIMYLYMSGPILERIEAALNVTVDYPVVTLDGEVLQGYSDGIDASGNSASIDGSNDTVTIPTIEHALSELDVGGSIIFDDPLNAANQGRFIINSIDVTTNTAVLETVYGMVTESPVDWIISRNYEKVVTTDRREYVYPYNVPMREDIQNPVVFGTLTFHAFEPLTLGFRVTDYVEDPNWWHGTDIPQMLWPITQQESGQSIDPRIRRKAVTTLYENIILSPDSNDYTCIGDPGFYIGADDQGNVFSPTDRGYNPDGTPKSPFVSDPVSVYRHNAAFVLFNEYLKVHIFFISISPDLELDADFKNDLQELILVAKPSYTYPNVELNDQFIDNVVLTDVFSIGNITFDLGSDIDGRLDSLALSNNELIIGDPNAPWAIGDFFKYENAVPFLTGVLADPLVPGTTFTVPSIPADAGVLTINLDCTRTVDGDPAIEGRDYTVDWLRENPGGVTNPNAWKVTFLTECSAGGSAPNVAGDVWYAERLQGVYDTTLGWTPINIGGTNPWYIRATALDPTSPEYSTEWAAVRSEHVDRPVQITIVVDPLGTPTSYTYL